MKKRILTLGFLITVLMFSIQGFSQGCVEATSDEGPQLMGYIQPEFTYFFNGEDEQGNAIKPSTFYFRRARFGIVGTIPYDVSYYVMAEFSPLFTGYPFLLDAYVSYAPFGKYAKFAVGQFKSPFGFELDQPCWGLHTILRSIPTEQLAAPLREFQFMVLGAIGKERDILTYKVSIMNGTGLGKMDQYIWGDTIPRANQNKDIAGRVVVKPWEWLHLGGGARTGLIGVKDEDGRSQSHTRYAVDFNFEKWNFRIQGEYLWGIDVMDAGVVNDGGGGCGGKKGTSAVTYKEHKPYGYWVQAMYMTPIRLEPVLKYEFYEPDGKNYNFYFRQLHEGFSQSIVTVGLNYFLNDWTRIQVNYLYAAEGKTNGTINEYDNDMFMIQAQVKF
jgi:hypothetical protein